MTTPSKFRQSEPFEATRNRSISMSSPTMPFRNLPLQRTANQAGVGPMQQSHSQDTQQPSIPLSGSNGDDMPLFPITYAN
ncbi:hypothetical protein JOM56_005202 [Amanita muscaria]